MADLQIAKYPCTWVFVDDEERFLKSMAMVAPPLQPVETYVSAVEALNKYGATDAGTIKEQPIRDLSEFPNEIMDPHRFAECSVFVVDYKMPEMNGLDFCRALHHHPAAKILLTGVADEEVASEAFNNGEIDSYVRKGDPEALDKIWAYAHQHTERYLAVKYPVSPSWPVDQGGLDLVSAVEALEKEYGWVERYFTSAPFGFLCVEATGAVSFLAIQNQSVVAESIKQAEAAGAPEAFLQRVRAGETLIVSFEEAEATGAFDWEYNSAQIVQTLGELSIGLHRSPPLDIDLADQRFSLEHYLEGLSAQTS